LLPVPVRVTLCALPALSAIVSVPARLPVAVGVNATLRLQLAPAATEAPQLLDWAKSPLAAMLVMFSVALPTFTSARICAALVVPTSWLPKMRLEAERRTAGPAPLPIRLTFCGLPPALSARLSVPRTTPNAAGVKVTLILQLAAGMREAGQLFVCAKPPGPVLMEEMLNDAPPTLAKVTVSAGLVTPRAWLLKLKVDGDRLTCGVFAVTPRLTTWGLPAALSMMLSVAAVAPLIVPVKTTLIVHFAPAASELPQLLLGAKLLALVLMLEIAKGSPPMFASVTACRALATPGIW
jgi:hypothetical protein